MAVRLMRLADWLAVAVAVSLPWSTSATGILIGAGLSSLLPTFDRRIMERVKFMAAVILPVAIVAYAHGRVAWSDVAWPVRLRGLPAVIKLLVIPLLSDSLSPHRRLRTGVRRVFRICCRAARGVVAVGGLARHLPWRRCRAMACR